MDENTGSFGANLGGIEALRQAMQRRGMDASILDQISASAPTGPSPVAASVDPATTNLAPSVDQTLQPATPQGIPQNSPQFRSQEMQTALKALEGVVKTENKIAESTLGIG